MNHYRNILTNWKTSIGAVVNLLICLVFLYWYLHTGPDFGKVCLALALSNGGVAFGLFLARDADKSSEHNRVK